MIAKLEQFVRELAQDMAFKELALQNPEAAVAHFGLTGPERAGALQLCAQLAGAPSPLPKPGRLWV